MATLNEAINRLADLAGTNTALSAAGSLANGADSVNALANQLDQLRGLFQVQAASTRENTDAVTRNTAGQSSLASTLASGTLSNVTRSASSVFSGLASPLAPIASGLLRLFGRNGSPEPAPALPTFSLPRTVAIDGSIQSGGTSAISQTEYAQDGLPRLTSAAATPRITVHVNAMDARSFLDRSDDIARAMKDALLNSHSVGDVIGEL